ncbi:ABC transporter substrate-binding protein [Roseomonas hellenica]|uniref:ABC transporter substrate-binding protein n=1 Tax=Plastoroseomonas hellenica TaxID=2687306 RepID=A0ABS5F576_9PROT|nr:ABC transporter substrate-binding protein [Plastoroseomonas hellenica]MBR0667731.1 ABC transporter substrate-binding protein [Plastoroseomonas hellenica]
MDRRRFLQAGAAGAAALVAPSLTQAQGARVFRFKPNADATILDPVFTTAFSTRYLALMSYDTLYGMDNALNPHPQMVAGHVIEDDGKRWRLTLREGLRFHDGAPVLARDCVASIRRWGRVDAMGQLLMSVTDELSAASDKEIVFRLKRPFALLPNALAKSTSFIPVIMPERLITDPAKQVTEVVGSGPFRYLANERVNGARSVWEKFAGYVPRPDGVTEFTSGPKIAHLDRVEWMIIPDAPTAAAAVISGEIDWYEDVLLDLVPLLRRDRNVVLGSYNPAGNMGILAINHLHPPFDNPAIRRAMLGAIDQSEVMTAVAGTDRALWNTGVGYFCPDSPMASDAGIAAMTAPRDYDRTRRELAAAGYRGEKVAFLQAANFYTMSQQVDVTADQMRRAGMNVEIIPVDFGVWLQRRANRAPVAQGGWNCTTTLLPGLDLWDPTSHLPLRGNGLSAWFGWPTAPGLEALRDEWIAAPELPARQAVARRIQEQAFQEVPYVPTGRWRDLTAYRRNVTGMLTGMPLFYNLRKG